MALPQRWAAAANRPASSASAEEPTNQGRDNVHIYHHEDGNDFVHKIITSFLLIFISLNPSLSTSFRKFAALYTTNLHWQVNSVGSKKPPDLYEQEAVVARPPIAYRIGEAPTGPSAGIIVPGAADCQASRARPCACA